MNAMICRMAAALLLITSVNSAYAEDKLQTPDCQLKQYGSVDLLVRENVYVPVTLDGHQGYMMLNIGSGLTVLAQDFATKAGLRVRRLDTSSVKFGGTTVKTYAAFNSLSLGPVRLGKGEFLTFAGPTGESTGNVIGALGMDVFSNVDFELDLAHGKLILFSQDHCPGNVVYWTNDYSSVPLQRDPLGTVTFPMELEGKKVQAVLTPAAEVSSLTTDVTRRLYGFDVQSPGVTTEDTPGGGKRSHYIAMKMTASGLTVNNPRINLRPPPSGDLGCRLVVSRGRVEGAGYTNCMGAVPLRIGRRLMKSLRLYFATKEKVLYFSAADATK
jgi:Aspartyl protease